MNLDENGKPQSQNHIPDIGKKVQIKQICDNPDVNALYLHSMDDLDNLPIPSDEMTLKEILQDVQDKRISVDASELLIKARFKISEG